MTLELDLPEGKKKKEVFRIVMPGTLKKSLAHILQWSGESENVSLFLNLE